MNLNFGPARKARGREEEEGTIMPTPNLTIAVKSVEAGKGPPLPLGRGR
jgi:hypothetical protein